MSHEKIYDPYFWVGIYNLIANEIPLNFDDDYLSSKILDLLLSNKALVSDEYLKDLISYRDVLIFGPLMISKEVLTILNNVKHDYLLVAVDGTVKAFNEVGLRPDIVVTDLDGDPRYLVKSCKDRTVCVVHAHGDNVDKLMALLPKFNGPIVGTSQVPPYGRLRFYGGFTDGDRALYFITYYKPRRVIVVGMDFTTKVIGAYSKPVNTALMRYVKIKKLMWGKYLIELLSRYVGNLFRFKTLGLNLPEYVLY
ncbi:MAG TPA: DUF115 domain-containing protein [Acidilobales archaeon]|nr:MAG: MAF flag10 domain containing protein [Desulfurococcales archaeon ex4484_42]HDD26736.1 DUF115 domain-containing protein [Acidilobales archaeon]